MNGIHLQYILLEITVESFYVETSCMPIYQKKPENNVLTIFKTFKLHILQVQQQAVCKACISENTKSSESSLDCIPCMIFKIMLS